MSRREQDWNRTIPQRAQVQNISTSSLFQQIAREHVDFTEPVSNTISSGMAHSLNATTSIGRTITWPRDIIWPGLNEQISRTNIVDTYQFTDNGDLITLNPFQQTTAASRPVDTLNIQHLNTTANALRDRPMRMENSTEYNTIGDRGAEASYYIRDIPRNLPRYRDIEVFQLSHRYTTRVLTVPGNQYDDVPDNSLNDRVNEIINRNIRRIIEENMSIITRNISHNAPLDQGLDLTRINGGMETEYQHMRRIDQPNFIGNYTATDAIQNSYFDVKTKQPDLPISKDELISFLKNSMEIKMNIFRDCNNFVVTTSLNLSGEEISTDSDFISIDELRDNE